MVKRSPGWKLTNCEKCDRYMWCEEVNGKPLCTSCKNGNTKYQERRK